MSAKAATPLAKIGSEDALKKPVLPQKKPLSCEAQHISSTLENCIRQVQTAAILPAVLLNNMPSVEDEVLRRALQEHQILEQRLETLVGLMQESDGEQKGDVEDARMRAKAQLQKDIKNSVRNILRLVRAHPDAISGLRAELGMEIGESENILIRGLEKFDSHVVEQLRTSLDEEEQQVLHKQVSSPPGHDLERAEEVATAIKQIDAEISQTNVEIENLQSALKGNNRQEADMQSLVEKQCQEHIKSSKVKQASIQQEIDQLNSQLYNKMLENRQAEREIQEKKENVETEIKCLLETFDNEMEKLQADLELNETDNEREEEELRKLEKSLSVLEVEYNQILEKRRLAEEKRKEEMRELELKTKAAIFAQAWWRGYSTRKALKNKGKSKKAKKGKQRKK